MILSGVDELENELDLELAWRLRELSAVRTLVHNSQNQTARNAALRASVPAIYAHWEGLIKRASELYLHFIVSRKLKVAELKPRIAGYCLQHEFSSAGGKSPGFDAGDALLFVSDLLQKTLKPRNRLQVATRSNLRYIVLEEITRSLHIEDFLSTVDKKFLDSELCDKRNFIAHGLSVPVTESDFDRCRSMVSGMMRDFKDWIILAALNEEYRN